MIHKKKINGLDEYTHQMNQKYRYIMQKKLENHY